MSGVHLWTFVVVLGGWLIVNALGWVAIHDVVKPSSTEGYCAWTVATSGLVVVLLVVLTRLS